MVQSIKHPDGLKKRTIDNLKYQYSGNQLFSVRDKLTEVCENYGFLNNGSSVKGQNTGGNYTNDREYYYDANGNLIKDRNKGIESIKYNLLNLPERILYKQNNAIYYTYDASGVKWAKEIHKDGGIKRFDYLGNFVYEDHVLKYIITDYGKIVVSKVNNPFIRYYDLRDHLGNVRASFRANENNTLTLLQEDSYYPFGMQHPSMSYLSRDTEHKNLHLYNGKELQTDFDLNWYDYEARFYDVELVRWHVVDALAEEAYSWTPYRYGFDNPIRYIDLNGMFETIYITGAYAEAATNQLNSSTNLNITRDAVTGKISATGKAKTKNDRNLLRAINSKDVIVNISAKNTKTTKNYTGTEGVYIGGAFKGNKIVEVSEIKTCLIGKEDAISYTVTSTKAITQQVVNPNVLGKLDKANGNNGKAMLHEVMESYIGGEISLKKGISSPMAGAPGSVYKRAHRKAPSQGGKIIEIYYDANGNIVPVLDKNVIRAEYKSKRKVIMSYP